MARWPIDRSWSVVNAQGNREQVHSRDLDRYRAAVLLGAAGLGKTFELKQLAEADRARGLDVRLVRLAELGQTPDGLASGFASLATSASADTVLYLDALDEVMVPVGTAGLVMTRWVSDTLVAAKPRLRISCRSAVWPPGVENAIRGVYGVDEYALAFLQPLSLEDVKRAASARGVDAVTFVREVEVAGVFPLAQQPLTLQMLLRLHATRGALPERRRDLFRDAMEELASEPHERMRNGTAVDVYLADLLEAAERLACYTLLSARDTIDLSDTPLSSALGVRELQRLPGGNRPLEPQLLRAIGRSGLCESDNPDRFRFAHRQFAEYLAGRRLAKLLPHQARALLGAGPGWQAGVAGPLREAAAFAAMESSDIASWVTDHDPEVVGLSDVADEALRRQATLNLLAKFRRHELTDLQVLPDRMELRGFQYDGAENDLQAVLKERQDGCEDVLECAVALIDSWGLGSISDALADLVLDVTAPLNSRKAAGYALAKAGTPEARQRLLPLIAGGPDDEDLDLKGLALRCNWPGGLTVPDLLSALTLPSRPNYFGAYASFLYSLHLDEFDARGHRLLGLRWARQFIRQHDDSEATSRIARRIAIAATDEIDEPGIAESLADLILDAAEMHAGSPLMMRRRLFLGDTETEDAAPVFAARPAARRKLIDAIAARATKEQAHWWWAVGEIQGLLLPDDFPWLIERATALALPMVQRENYAKLAKTLPWRGSVAGIEAWFAARETEPIASQFPYPLSIALDSEEAAEARRDHAESERLSRPVRRKRLRPRPAKRVEQVLALSEIQDARFFLDLCRELTLEEYSFHYGFARFLTTTPGWMAADEGTRNRIINSAKRYLDAASDEPQSARNQPLTAILPGPMAAIWLVMECDPGWIDSLPEDWWRRWAWYILRELHPHLIGESEEPKQSLLRKLQERAPAEVRASLESLATSAGAGTRDLLQSLLGALDEIEDVELDALLSTLMVAGDIPDDRVGDVAEFILSRSGDQALAACLSRLDATEVTKREDAAIQAAVALLCEQTQVAWSSVFELLERRPDLAARVLGDSAHGGHSRFRRNLDEDRSGLADLPAGQIAELVSLLFEVFPGAAPLHTRVYSPGPDDSARHLRDRLISRLGEQRDLEAVEALRALERKFGTKHPWLRRPRAAAERSYRLSRWVPLPPGVVAEVLSATGKRLVRSGRDAVDGVEAAITSYARDLRHDSPSDLEDLWNLPTQGPPTPKTEERVSDKLCIAVRRYFRDFAVVADREVQVFRRKLSPAAGGAPGSEVDLLCRVSPAGAVDGDAIAVPIEVKLAHNAEARTGLREQLFGRYMSELGTDFGVFVVAWMGAQEAAGGYRPLWATPEAAREELEEQARQVMSSAPEILCIRVVVIDASLPLAAVRPARKKKTAKKPRPKGAAARD